MICSLISETNDFFKYWVHHLQNLWIGVNIILSFFTTNNRIKTQNMLNLQILDVDMGDFWVRKTKTMTHTHTLSLFRCSVQLWMIELFFGPLFVWFSCIVNTFPRQTYLGTRNSFQSCWVCSRTNSETAYQKSWTISKHFCRSHKCNEISSTLFQKGSGTFSSPKKHQFLSWYYLWRFCAFFFKLSKLFFLFPDPHFKRKNTKRRIIKYILTWLLFFL